MFLLLVLVVCGGDSDNDYGGLFGLVICIGIFVDSLVVGFDYVGMDSVSGVINDVGEFCYWDGEIFVFFIGDLLLGSVKGVW